MNIKKETKIEPRPKEEREREIVVVPSTKSLFRRPRHARTTLGHPAVPDTKHTYTCGKRYQTDREKKKCFLSSLLVHACMQVHARLSLIHI